MKAKSLISDFQIPISVSYIFISTMSDDHATEHNVAAPQIPSPEAIAQAEAAMRRPPGRRQYAKIMGKMGLKPEPEIVKVTIRKQKNISFVINAPEVYKYPGSDAFVLFGEPTVSDDMQDYQKAMAQQFARSAPEVQEAEAVEEIDEDVSAEGLEEKDIELVVSQAMVSRGKAIKALRENDGDIVNTIMSLTM